MMNQRVTVRFTDGTEAEQFITQYEMGQFDMWAMRQGFGTVNGVPAIQAMPIVFMRYGAYVATFRAAPSGRPKFESWDETVLEVDAEDTEPLGPTETGTPAGPSPD
jgi:hypothetical protein